MPTAERSDRGSLRPIGLGLASALLSLTAFTSLNLGALSALVMFVPVLHACRLPRANAAIFTYASVFSICIFFGTQHYSWLAYLFSVLALTAFLSLPVLAFRWYAASKGHKPASIWLFASVYTVWDWLWSLQTLFPVGRVAATLADVPFILQPATVMGPFGVGFLLLVFNGAVARYCAVSGTVWADERKVPIALGIGSATWLTLCAMIWWSDTPSSKVITVAVVQGAVTREMYSAKQTGDRDAAAEIRSRYVDATEKQAGTVDLVIWPETALWGFSEDRDRIALMLNETKQRLLGGFPVRARAEDGGAINLNAAIYLNGIGVPSSIYVKKYLLPVFEQAFSSGNSGPTVLTDLGSFATPICFEAVLTHYFREQANADAGAMVVLSNDAGFEWSLVSYYMLKQALLNSVAVKKPLIRSGQSGVSAIATYRGQVLVRSALFERTVLVGAIALNSGQSLYGRFGDWTPSLGLLLLVVAWAKNACRTTSFFLTR
jgi:apolipoprotein N-acyltransferase